MKSFHALVFIGCVSVIFQACSTIADLEDENIQLHATIDSLEIQSAECESRNASFTEKIAALEKENLRLDDRNRQLSARLAEIAALPVTSVSPGIDPARINAPVGIEKGGERQVSIPDPTFIPPSSAVLKRTPVTTSTLTTENFLSRYQAALSEYNKKNFQRSIDLFQQLLNSSQPNDMMDNCEYWIGESLFALGNYRIAIEHFSNVLNYRGSDKADDALMMRGNAYLNLNANNEARKDFQRILTEFPSSEYASRAKAKLKGIR